MPPDDDPRQPREPVGEDAWVDLADEFSDERDADPETVEEALRRARRHGRAAASETLEMLRALLDAGALVAHGGPSASSRLLGPLANLLDGLSAQLADEPTPDGAPVVEAIAQALDAEIARWEERARETPEARAVLRAFLGLRELLWEFGVRPGAEATASKPRGRRNGNDDGTSKRTRVQRVPVEG